MQMNTPLLLSQEDPAPEALRVNDQVVEFVKQVNEQGEVTAGICHAPQLMISADILEGKNTACFIGIHEDVKNAGSNVLDQEVVVDGKIIISRTPKNEPAFIEEILNKL